MNARTFTPANSRASGGIDRTELSDGTANLPVPTPPPKIDLRDAHAIRRELAAVYRDMRSGAIEAQDGTRMAYVLDLIRKAFETGVLQDRIESLECAIAPRRPKP